MSVYPTSPPKMTYSRTADKHADAVPREGFNWFMTADLLCGFGLPKFAKFHFHVALES